MPTKLKPEECANILRTHARGTPQSLRRRLAYAMGARAIDLCLALECADCKGNQLEHRLVRGKRCPQEEL